MDSMIVASGRGNDGLASVNNKIVLHEDKQYYASAEEVYGDVKTVTLDQDAQDLTEPIIKPIVVKNFSVLEKEPPSLTYNPEFMQTLVKTPSLVRNIAFVGQLHHGKTLFLDTLVQETHEKTWNPSTERRYTDTRKDEQERELSVKSTPISLILENFIGKSHLFNIMDCPGHVNFSDEVTAGLRAVDGAVIVVDAVEGVMLNTERVIRQCVEDGIEMCVVINKVDRLILELKLPPQDAYFKIMHTLEEINKVIMDTSAAFLDGCDYSISDCNYNQNGSGYYHHEGIVNGAVGDKERRKPKRISPELGNVCFASSVHGWSFTVRTFAERYCKDFDQRNGYVDPVALSKRLWGDWSHDASKGAFVKISKSRGNTNAQRSFVQFILEPLYKIYARVLGEDPAELAVLMKQLGIRMASSELHMDPKPLLSLVFSRYFGYPHGFVEMILTNIPSPLIGNFRKIRKYYNGKEDGAIAKSMIRCDASGPLVIHVMKMYSTSDGAKFMSLGRVFSGTIKTGQKVKVLGESFVLMEDEEDMAIEVVGGLHISVGRFSVAVDCMTPGGWVLIEGVDSLIKKTATITDVGERHGDDFDIFRPLKFDNVSTVKVAIEPLHPAELPKMIEAMRKINKSYPLISTRVEESGEHILIGTGELYMDCVLHDLRHMYGDLEIKVADPVVSFCETVVETSSVKCYADTPNKKNRLTLISEPLEAGLADDIEHKRICLDWDKKKISDFFCGKYDWDLMASRSVWAFGADDNSPNMLIDDTLAGEVDKVRLSRVKDSIIQGFRWGCREGPLCEEPIRNVKFKLLDASIAAEPIFCGGGQVIPTARRVAYSSFLMATPRLMEPVYLVEIQAPVDVIPAIYPVLARRRGHVIQDNPKPGTPFYTVKAYLPVMDSFGFEVDVRSYTQGQAFCLQVFDHYSVVPGDPLDDNVILHLLEPSPPLALAKDFMVKTRRRKGLNEEVSIEKYVDDEELLERIRYMRNARSDDVQMI